MRLDQLLAAAAPADAVTNQALAWRRLLAGAGIGGDIYAEHVHPDLAGTVRPLTRFPSGGAGPTLLRYSIWSAAAERAREVPAHRLALLYHNITPGHLLSAQPALAALCDRGRRELASFAGRVTWAIADSGYNADELRAAGFPEPTVVPLLLDLPTAPPGRGDAAPEPVVLSVGRVAPSKRIEEAIRAVALLRGRVPGARLEVIGAWDGFDGYRAALDAFAGRLGARDAIHFRGRVSDQARDAAYAGAGVYLCTSAHEGFCAPLVEALAHGLPVVAHDAGAVAETLGGAGLVVPGADAALTAEALQEVLAGAPLRAELSRRADARLAELAPAVVGERVLAAVAPLVR